MAMTNRGARERLDSDLPENIADIAYLKGIGGAGLKAALTELAMWMRYNGFRPNVVDLHIRHVAHRVAASTLFRNSLGDLFWVSTSGGLSWVDCKVPNLPTEDTEEAFLEHQKLVETRSRL